MNELYLLWIVFSCANIFNFFRGSCPEEIFFLIHVIITALTVIGAIVGVYKIVPIICDRFVDHFVESFPNHKRH